MLSKETKEWVVRIVQVALLAILSTVAGLAKKDSHDLNMTVEHMARVQGEILHVLLTNGAPVAGPEEE